VTKRQALRTKVQRILRLLFERALGLKRAPRCSIELVDWCSLRLAIRAHTVDQESLKWMTDSIFWLTFLACEITEDDTVFDLGSHIGSFALRAAAHCHCRVWATEPDHESATLHRINAAMNHLEQTQDIAEVAVGELDGAVDFHEATANWAHTTMAVGSDANILTGTTIQVQCLSLSGCFARSRANRCSFMKLNIEGAEFGFIRGATESDLCRVDTIVAELHFDLALGESETELINKLAAAGFRSQILPTDSKFRAFLVARR
jgi:FkbM family methyltransferase